MVRPAGECISSDMLLARDVTDLEAECEGLDLEVEKSGVGDGGKFLRSECGE